MKWHGDCKDGWVPTYYRQDVDDTHDEGNSSSIASLGELMVPQLQG